MKGSGGGLYSSVSESFNVSVNKTDQAMGWAEELNDFFFSAWLDITRVYGTICRELRGQRQLWSQNSMHTEEGLGQEW